MIPRHTQSSLLLSFLLLATTASAQSLAEAQKEALRLVRAGEALQAAEGLNTFALSQPSAASWLAAGRAFAQARRFARAAQALEQVRLLAPERPDAIFDLAMVLYQGGELERALEQLRSLSARTSTTMSPQQLAAIPLWRGRIADKLDRGPEALEAFEAAVQLAPKDPEARAELVRVLFAQDRLKQALTHAKALASMKPKMAEAHYRVGALQRRLGEGEDALVALEKAIRLDGKHDKALMEKGIVLQGAEKLAKAREAHLGALRANPKLFESHRALATIERRLGRKRSAERHRAQYEALQAESRSLEERIRTLRRKLDSAPGSAPTMFAIAEILAANGKPQEARTWLERTLASDPQHALARVNLAQFLGMRGQLGAAILEHRRVLETRPNQPIANLELGRAYAMQRQLPKAFGHMMKGLPALKSSSPSAALGGWQMIVQTAAGLSRLTELTAPLAAAEKRWAQDSKVHPNFVVMNAGVALQTGVLGDALERTELALQRYGDQHPASKRMLEAAWRLATSKGDVARAQQFRERWARLNQGP